MLIFKCTLTVYFYAKLSIFLNPFYIVFFQTCQSLLDNLHNRDFKKKTTQKQTTNKKTKNQNIITFESKKPKYSKMENKIIRYEICIVTYLKPTYTTP